MLSSYAEMEDAVGNEEWERINQPEVRKRVQNRLSQRRHRDKLRQQREPVSHEIIIPPSFTSSYTMEGAPGTSDYPSPSLSFNGQEDRHNLSRPNQPQEGYDAFDAFNAQDMLPPDHTVSTTMAQPAQAGSVGMNRSMTPHMGRPAMNNSYQPTNMQPLGSLASGPPTLPAVSRNEYWDSQSLSDPQWAIPSFHQNSVPASNLPASTNNPRHTSSHMPRPMVRPMPRRVASSNQQTNILPTARASDSHSSPVLQRNIANQAFPRSGSHLENANTESESTRKNNDACSHCRTCRAPSSFDDQKPGQASPKTPTSTPSRDSSGTNSPDHLEILANCSKVLANLARQSDYRDENEPEERPRSSKRSKTNQDGYFVDVNRTLQEDDYGDGHHRHNVIGKVVILCVKNGRKTKGK